MKVLLIGFGSIGQRHFEILNSFSNVSEIDVVSKHCLKNAKSYKELSDIENITIYDYFIIASETAKHYEHLKFICSKVTAKTILVEKPLYDIKHDDFELNNNVFIAYNLRFHPIINRLKELIYNQKIYYVNVICGQYLPTWRPSQDYTKSYSSDIKRGGGVLRDLSHELDYITWLFGEFDKIEYINTKISDLKINSDDIFTAIAVTKNRSIVNITVDYISKIPMRRVIIHTEEITIDADIINNIIVLNDKNNNTRSIDIEAVERNYTYEKMHKSILENTTDSVCGIEAGKKVVDIIETIVFKDINE